MILQSVQPWTAEELKNDGITDDYAQKLLYFQDKTQAELAKIYREMHEEWVKRYGDGKIPRADEVLALAAEEGRLPPGSPAAVFAWTLDHASGLADAVNVWIAVMGRTLAIRGISAKPVAQGDKKAGWKTCDLTSVQYSFGMNAPKSTATRGGRDAGLRQAWSSALEQWCMSSLKQPSAPKRSGRGLREPKDLHSLGSEKDLQNALIVKQAEEKLRKKTPQHVLRARVAYSQRSKKQSG